MNTLIAYSYLVCANEIILICCIDVYSVFLVAKWITPYILSNLEHVNIERILNSLNLGIMLKYQCLEHVQKVVYNIIAPP